MPGLVDGLQRMQLENSYIFSEIYTQKIATKKRQKSAYCVQLQKADNHLIFSEKKADFM